MDNSKFLPKPIKAPAQRRGFIAALVVALLAFVAVDAYAQVTAGGFVITRFWDGTNIINAGDNGNNALRVNVVAGSAGGPSKVDDAAFTVAVDSVAPAGFMFDDVSPDSVNEGDVGIVRMSANRNLYATLRDAAGNERGVNVSAGNALLVDASATTQPVSGTVTANQGGTWTVQPGNTANTTPWLANGSSLATSNNDGAVISVTTTSGTVLASFSTRKFASVCSIPTNTDIIYLRLAATATTSDYPLYVGACFNIAGPYPYTGIIDARSASGTQSAAVAEW